MTTNEDALARLAAGQQGLFTYDDAARCGIATTAVARRIARGLLVERQPGVLGSPSTPYDVRAAGRAALLSVGDTAMLSHLSAAYEWNLRRELPQKPWITVPWARSAPELWDVEVIRSRHLQGVRRRRNGVAVTSPPRTVVDVGRVLDRNGVESALATALQAGLVSLPDVEIALTRAWRTAGTGLVRDVLKHFDPAWESVLSARLGRLLKSAGLDVVAGFEIRRQDGRLVAVADFADPVRRLVIEADGWAFHGSKEQQQADRQRDRTLLLMGWTTVRYTTADILEQPEQVVAEIRALLSADNRLAR
jgi:very-short-patch-repair endonuclease